MPEPLLTIAGAAAYLGLKVATLREWCWQKRIAHVKLGRAVRFRPADLDALIEGSTIPPAAPPADLASILAGEGRHRRRATRPSPGASPHEAEPHDA